MHNIQHVIVLGPGKTLLLVSFAQGNLHFFAQGKLLFIMQTLFSHTLYIIYTVYVLCILECVSKNVVVL